MDKKDEDFDWIIPDDNNRSGRSGNWHLDAEITKEDVERIVVRAVISICIAILVGMILASFVGRISVENEVRSVIYDMVQDSKK